MLHLRTYFICLAIAFRRMKKDIASIKEAVDSLDQEALSPEEVDILGTMAPKEDEVCMCVRTCIHVCVCM